METPSPLRRTLSGHTGSIRACCFSPSGALVASGSGDATVRLWDVTTGDAVRALTGHSSKVNAVTFSPDGACIASGAGTSWDIADAEGVSTVVVWDAETGGALHTLTGHTEWIAHCSFSRSGRLLVSGSSDNTLRVWDMAQPGKPVVTLTGHTRTVTSCCFSPVDDSTICSSGKDGTLRLWDVGTGRELHVLAAAHAGSANACAFSADGMRVLSAGGKNNYPNGPPPTDAYAIHQRDATSLQPHAGAPLLRGHTGPVRSMGTCSGDDRMLVTGGCDGTVRVWDTVAGVARVRVSQGAQVLSCAASPDGSLVLGGCRDDKLYLWDTAAAEVAFEAEREAAAAAAAARRDWRPSSATGSYNTPAAGRRPPARSSTDIDRTQAVPPHLRLSAHSRSGSDLGQAATYSPVPHIRRRGSSTEEGLGLTFLRSTSTVSASSLGSAHPMPSYSFFEELPPPPLPRGKEHHVFLTHDWGDADELGRNNHESVARINAGLQARGLETWFDSDRLEDDILNEISRGIESSCVVAVFITQRYCQKVASPTKINDFCRDEFAYARRRCPGMLIPVPMEPRMRNPADWVGPVGFLGDALYKAQFATLNEDEFDRNIDLLYRDIVRKVPR